MRRTSIVLLFALLLVVACNGALRVQAPALKAVIMDTASIIVFWEQNSTIESNIDFVGYNIYVYTDSSALLVENGEELNKFNSFVIEDTTYQVNGLSQDSIYYVQVRTVNTDDKVGDYNSATPFLKASPRPEFAVTMHMADLNQQVNDSCAIRFADAMVMADAAMADSTADAWLAIENDTVWLMSPASHPIYGTGARNTLYRNMGPGDFDGISMITTDPDLAEVYFVTGDIIFARTEDDYYVKIYIESIDIQNNAVALLYAYQNIVGLPYF
jgi:hypothetical protein